MAKYEFDLMDDPANEATIAEYGLTVTSRGTMNGWPTFQVEATEEAFAKFADEVLGDDPEVFVL